jgi:Flp pilus assembly pilin Flp
MFRFGCLGDAPFESPNSVPPGARAPTRGGETTMTYLNGFITRLLAAGRREEGQTMAEYGVILAVITVAIIAVLVLLSDGIRNNLQAVVDVLS